MRPGAEPTGWRNVLSSASLGEQWRRRRAVVTKANRPAACACGRMCRLCCFTLHVEAGARLHPALYACADVDVCPGRRQFTPWITRNEGPPSTNEKSQAGSSTAAGTTSSIPSMASSVGRGFARRDAFVIRQRAV